MMKVAVVPVLGDDCTAKGKAGGSRSAAGATGDAGSPQCHAVG